MASEAVSARHVSSPSPDVISTALTTSTTVAAPCETQSPMACVRTGNSPTSFSTCLHNRAVFPSPVPLMAEAAGPMRGCLSCESTESTALGFGRQPKSLGSGIFHAPGQFPEKFHQLGCPRGKGLRVREPARLQLRLHQVRESGQCLTLPPGDGQCPAPHLQ